MESVWRNAEGFIFTHASFLSSQPDGNAADTVDVNDCLMIGTAWLDYWCTDIKEYYCEGVVNQMTKSVGSEENLP